MKKLLFFALCIMTLSCTEYIQEQPIIEVRSNDFVIGEETNGVITLTKDTSIIIDYWNNMSCDAAIDQIDLDRGSNDEPLLIGLDNTNGKWEGIRLHVDVDNDVSFTTDGVLCDGCHFSGWQDIFVFNTCRPNYTNEKWDCGLPCISGQCIKTNICFD